MNQIVDRFLRNWKTTAGGLLAVAGVVISAVHLNAPSSTWTLTAAAIVAGLTGLLAKDK